MKTMPNLHAQVRFPGNMAVGPCSGRVVKLWPGYEGHNEDGPFIVQDSVSIEVDDLPTRWPYLGRDRFVAEVAVLQLVKE